MDRKYYTAEQILDALSYIGVGAGDISEVMSCLERLPSAEPVIIRCKDCKHHAILHDMDWCHGKRVTPDFFCGYAERRDDE